jgi:hypothetical protein
MSTASGDVAADAAALVKDAEEAEEKAVAARRRARAARTLWRRSRRRPPWRRSLSLLASLCRARLQA